MVKEIKTIKIGSKRLKNNLFLAPLLGYTNWAFRELVQKNTEISVFTEMIPINALSKDSNYCKDIIKKGDLEKNVFYQFFGNDEEKLVKSIQNILDLGISIDFINLNCGCPAADIVAQGAGSALLKRQSKINTMIEASKKAFDIPFTIKIRSGYDITKHLDYNKLEDSGLDGLFIHSRTKKQQYSGKIDLNFLKETKEKTNLPIIANGDIHNMEDITNIHNETDCDGYMLGREALSNPFVFDEILYGNYSTFQNKLNFLMEYHTLLLKDQNNSTFSNAKNLSMFLVREVRNASKLREEISKTKTFFEITQLLKKVE